jgi:hypothetical protein
MTYSFNNNEKPNKKTDNQEYFKIRKSIKKESFKLKNLTNII